MATAVCYVTVARFARKTPAALVQAHDNDTTMAVPAENTSATNDVTAKDSADGATVPERDQQVLVDECIEEEPTDTNNSNNNMVAMNLGDDDDDAIVEEDDDYAVSDDESLDPVLAQMKRSQHRN